MRRGTRRLLAFRGGCTDPDPVAGEIEPRVWLCSWCGDEPGDCTCRPPERSEDV